MLEIGWLYTLLWAGDLSHLMWFPNKPVCQQYENYLVVPRTIVNRLPALCIRHAKLWVDELRSEPIITLYIRPLEVSPPHLRGYILVYTHDD